MGAIFTPAMKERALLLALWVLCWGAAWFAGLRMLWAIATSPERAWKLAVAHDQLANAAANGHEDETISSRAGRARREGRRWGCVLCRLLDALDPDHCNRSIGN